MSWDSPFLRVTRRDAPAIAYRLFSPAQSAKAAVLISHGYFENMQRYREVIGRWNDLGLLVAIYDLRGHGESEGRRGYVDRFHDYVSDTLALLAHLKRHDAWAAHREPALFGHSFGGLVSIHTALEAPHAVSGLALASPYLALAQTVPPLKLAAGRLLSRLLPQVSLAAGLRGADSTRNAQVSSAYDRDPMNFQKANVRWFTETQAAQERALRDAPKITVPVFCVQAGEDKIAAPAATERFMDRVNGVPHDYVRLPGLYHEVLNEPERAPWIDRFASEIIGFRSVPVAQERA
jgi:alpha-beta hydrolase superfamily lysophospholipase